MVRSMADVQSLVDGLNPQQRKAVEHRGCPVLVLAGAGSGKTRVITVRIAHLIAEGLPAERILALTFTNKAAGEMAERVAGLVGRDAARLVTVGTFHSLGLRMLEEDNHFLGFGRRFTLLDAADQASAMRQCLKARRIDPRRHDPRMFLGAISNARNAGERPEDLKRDPSRRLIGEVYQAYIEWMHAYRAIDFDDLILRPVQLLTEHEELRDKWRGRFQTILVDEYQDTNMMQLALVRLLAEEHRSLCVVGDDDQSIYGWRGASLDNILGFERFFTDAKTIALTQNYRSTGHILKAANAVIAKNKARKVKSLWTDVGDGAAVQVVRCKDERSEASFVAATIARRAAQESRRYSDFGVLFRTSGQAQAFEEAFRLAGIPYSLVGAYDFFERKEVKVMLAYLKLVTNPRDYASLMRVINFPHRGVGPRTLEKIQQYARSHHMTPMKAIAHADEIGGIKKRTLEALREFDALIREARFVYDEAHDPLKLLNFICDKTNAREAWIRDPTEGPGGHQRWRNVERLIRSLEGFVQRKPGADLLDFLRLLALDKREAGEEDERDEVALMTLHAAKGLEWPVCFVVGCQEGLIPHQKSIETGDVSEERRLFYVGITRARRHCYLSYARTRRKFRGSEPTRPSRFLRDIPAEHREDLDRGKGGEEVERSEAKSRFAALRAQLGPK